MAVSRGVSRTWLNNATKFGQSNSSRGKNRLLDLEDDSDEVAKAMERSGVFEAQQSELDFLSTDERNVVRQFQELALRGKGIEEKIKSAVSDCRTYILENLGFERYKDVDEALRQVHASAESISIALSNEFLRATQFLDLSESFRQQTHEAPRVYSNKVTTSKLAATRLMNQNHEDQHKSPCPFKGIKNGIESNGATIRDAPESYLNQKKLLAETCTVGDFFDQYALPISSFSREIKQDSSPASLRPSVNRNTRKPDVLHCKEKIQNNAILPEVDGRKLLTKSRAVD